jgi:hypothetical protein
MLAQLTGNAGADARRPKVFLHASEFGTFLPQLAFMLVLDGLAITLEKSLIEKTVRGSQASPCEPQAGQYVNHHLRLARSQRASLRALPLTPFRNCIQCQFIDRDVEIAVAFT